MKKLIFSIFSMAIFASGCAKKSEAKFEDVGPRISEGYYAIESAENYNVPLVAIIKTKGLTYAYSFYWYECEGKVFSIYDKTGTTFDDNPVFAGGPNVTVLGKNCNLKSDIVADSDSTIKIKVSLNRQEQQAYILRKVSKEEFLTGLISMSKVSDSFKTSEDTCQKSLGEACSALKIKATVESQK